MRRLVMMSGLMAAGSTAWAGSCEDAFQSVGDPRNGLYFEVNVKVPGLKAQSALGQLRQYALDGGYDVGNELIEGSQGELSFLQTTNRPALVIRAVADDTGAVSLALKLGQRQKTKPEDVRTEFCSILGKLKPGKEGEAIAAAARAKSGAGQVIDAEAPRLSAEIGKDMKNTLGPVASKGDFSRRMIGSGPRATEADFNEAFAPMRAKYLGRKYRIDGQVYTSTINSVDRQMEVNYLVTQKRGLLGVQQDTQYNDLNFQIKCLLAKDQGRLFQTLAEGNFVKLEGVVAEIQPGGMTLKECRQAK